MRWSQGCNQIAVVVWLMACGPATSEPTAPPAIGETVPPTGSSKPPSKQQTQVWLHDGPEIVGVAGDVVFHWDDAGQGSIVSTSIKTGLQLSSRAIHGSRINGQPRLWAEVSNGFVTSWDGPTLITEKEERLDVAWEARGARWSTTLVAGDRLVSWQHEPTPEIVAHAVADGRELWRTPIAPGANGYDLFIAGDQLLVVWQQYSPTAPTPTITIPQRARAIALRDGTPRWTRDFHAHTGGMIANGNTLVVAEGADLRFIDGPSGALIKKVPTGHSPNIYPKFAVQDDHVYVALNDAVTAYDAKTGDEVWRFPVRLDGGPALAVAGDQLLVSTEYASLVAIARGTGRDVWEAGVGLRPHRLLVTKEAVVAVGAGASGFLLPANFVPERALIKGRVKSTCRPVNEARLRIGDKRLQPAINGEFAATVNMAGLVLVSASFPSLDREGRPAHTVVKLDGRGSYDVGTLAVDFCDR